MSEGYSIGKDKKNPQQGYKYRGIDDVMNVFQPLLAKYKVFIVPEVLSHEREERTNKNGTLLLYSVCTIKYTFYAEDGSSISAVVIGEGMDSGDKATNKAMSVAMKYAMFQTFCIPTEEMQDSEKDSPEPLPKAKAESKEDWDKTLEKMSITRIINETELAELKALCKTYKRDESAVAGRYKKNSLAELSLSMYEDVLKVFDKIRNKEQ